MNEKLKKKISGDGFKLGDRMIAIIVVVVFSALSFALGYFVGGAAGKGSGQLADATPQVVETLAPVQPQAQPQSPVTQPQIMIVNDTQPEAGQAQIANELDALPPDETSVSSPAPVMKPKSAKKEPAAKAKEPVVTQEASKETDKKAQAATAKPEAKSTSTALYTVQVGAFKGQAEADALKKRVADKGYSAFVQKSTSKTDPVPYKVRVGSFKDKKDAEAISAKLTKTENLKCFITHKD